MSFELHPALAKKDFILDLPLCRVLLEDNQHYPWLFLVPRKENVRNLLGLTLEERQRLMAEMEHCEKVLWELFQPAQINIAAIGNKTPQLHVHIICRFENDPAWPKTVWEQPRTPYLPHEKQARIEGLKKALILP